MAISLTESAATRVRPFLPGARAWRRPAARCAQNRLFRLRYVINFADRADPDDAVFEDRGVQVFVDRSSLDLIDGTVGFVKEGLNRPSASEMNVKGECGCGELLRLAAGGVARGI
jgi:iron-sulfur cluster assembly protein